MKIYLAGQITGLTEQVYKRLFEDAENKVRSDYFEPVNPTKLPHGKEDSWQTIMKRDIVALMDCDAIYMLNNWKRSKGARLEHSIATALGLKIFYQF